MNLESASLPSTLTYIGSGAFMPADEYPSAAGKLNSITIPDAVTTIGGGAFWGAALLRFRIMFLQSAAMCAEIVHGWYLLDTRAL